MHFLVILLFFKLGYSQNIYTYAGIGGSGGFSGDGGPAISAQLWTPLGVLANSSGSVYISDSQTGHIRIVNSSGIINTFAGGGSGGDGGPAINALIGNPYKICFDPAGNMYIAEYGYNRVRKISTTGIITTVAGDGSITGGFSGDGGLATLAKLKGPSGVAVDGSGNIYIADMGNSRIRMVNSSGTIATIAGTGLNTYSGDGGPATSATLNLPLDIEIDAGGNILIADYANRCVRKINSLGIISTIAGTGVQGNSGDGGPAISAQMGAVTGIDIDVSGNLYIADVAYGTIRKVNPLGVITTIAGTGTQGYSGDGGPALSAKIDPYDISVDVNGNIYIAEATNNRVRIVCVSSCALGIDENKTSYDFDIYPNPANKMINVGTKNVFINTEIEITNTLGQTVLKQPFSEQIDISLLEQGCYFIKISSGDKLCHSKFIKE